MGIDSTAFERVKKAIEEPLYEVGRYVLGREGPFEGSLDQLRLGDDVFGADYDEIVNRDGHPTVYLFVHRGRVLYVGKSQEKPLVERYLWHARRRPWKGRDKSYEGGSAAHQRLLLAHVLLQEESTDQDSEPIQVWSFHPKLENGEPPNSEELNDRENKLKERFGEWNGKRARLPMDLMTPEKVRAQCEDLILQLARKDSQP